MRHPLLLAIAGSISLLGCSDHSSGAPASTILDVVAFDTRQLVPAGVDRVAACHAADIDGDGLVDMAILGTDGRLVLEIAQRPGVFAIGAGVQLGGEGLRLRAADLDADGDIDLVAASRTGAIDVLANDGAGGLTQRTSVAVGADLVDIVLTDIDGDSVDDLVCVRFGARAPLWLRGIGDGTFAGIATLNADLSGAAVGLASGDFDGDGLADLAIPDLDRRRVTLLLGDVAVRIPAVQIDVPLVDLPFGVTAGDIDGDGVDEVLVSVLGVGTVSVVGHDGARAFSVRQSLTVGGGPGALTLGDTDGDGDRDLIVGLIRHRALAVFRNDGGTFAAIPTRLPTTGSPLEPQAVDIDADGIPDVVAPALGIDSVNLFRGRGPSLAGGRLHLVPGLVEADVVAAADFDGDGRIDVAASGFTTREIRFLRVLGSGGDESVEQVGLVDCGDVVQNAVPADLDGDGRVDLMVATLGGVRVLANRSSAGALAFDLLPVAGGGFLAAGDGPFEMLARDLDGDGAVDLAAAFHAADKVVVLRGRPAAPFEFEPVLELALPGRPAGLAAGDFDGDGALELATSRIGLSRVTTIEITPNGLEAGVDAPVGAGPNYLRSADFDGDGRDDLVVSNGETDQLTVLLGAPAGFQSLVLDAGRLPTALLTRDLNRDGFADILVASMAGADFRVLLGDGQGGFGQALVFPGVYSAVTAAFGDLDGDGLEDLLVGSVFSGGFATFRNVSRASDG